MTDPSEVTKAIEAVAEALFLRHKQQPSWKWTDLYAQAQERWREDARAILSIENIRVVAEDQAKPKLSRSEDSSLYTWAEGQESMTRAGFERVLRVKGE